MQAGDLEAFAVRITSLEKAHLGTGFFVGPGLVATCAHVVGPRIAIAVHWQGQSITGKVTHGDTSLSANEIILPDVALIALDEILGDGVELEESFTPGDLLHAWGYPSEARDGSSIQGECEGPHHFGPEPGRRLIKIKGTQLTPGFSGSPVWNQRTGKVCGMLKRTRDEMGPRGGYAVRAATLLALPEVDAAQRKLVTPLRSALQRYLQRLAAECAQLPAYFPKRLQGFDQIRQRVRTVEGPNSFHQMAAERYDPLRARPEEKEISEREQQQERVSPRIVVEDWERIRTEPRFRQQVILGDPGFGKSWLLRYEARRRSIECQTQLADRDPSELTIPILVKLQDLARAARNTQTLAQSLDRALESSGVEPVIRHYLTNQLSKGRVALLMDAWDEVPSADRAVIKQQLEVWSRDYTGPAMMTARPAGFGASPMPSAPVLELVAFERNEVNAFAKLWLGPDRGNAFLAELDQREAVNGLARIPLLLSLLCRTYEEDAGVFPERRTDLYHRVLRGLFYGWQREDKAAEIGELEFQRVFDNAAQAAHRVYPASQFSETEFAGGTSEDGERLIASLLRGGVLSRVGAGSDTQLMFLHRTFHEYLVARHAARQPWEEATIDRWSTDLLWRPVLILMAGELDQPRALIALLANRWKDDVLRPRLALAVLCLREIVPEKRVLVNEITHECIEEWLRYERRGLSGALVSLEAVMEQLVSLNGRYRGMDLPEFVLSCKERTLWRAVEVFGPSIASSGLETYVLEKLDATDDLVRRQASEAARRLAPRMHGEPVIQKLISLLDDSYVGREATSAIEHMGEQVWSEGLVDSLISALTAGKWEAARNATSLLQGMSADEQLTSRLLMCLENSSDAAEVLKRMRKEAPLVNALVELIGSPQWSLREHAKVALSGDQPTEWTSNVVSRLADLLIDPLPYIPESAAQVLGMAGAMARNPIVVERLTGCLRDPNVTESLHAGVALLRIGEQAMLPEVILRLEKALHAGGSKAFAAAKAIEVLGPVAWNPTIEQGLFNLLSNEEDYVANCAARAFGSIGLPAASPRLVQQFEQMLDETNPRFAAIDALEEMVESPIVLTQVEAWFGHKDYWKRFAAKEALKKSIHLSIVGECLIRLLAHPKRTVRKEAMQLVCEYDKNVWTDQQQQVILARLQDPDPQIRGLAAKAIASLTEATNPQTLHALAANWRADNWYVQRGSITALGQIQSRNPHIHLWPYLPLTAKAAELLWRLRLHFTSP